MLSCSPVLVVILLMGDSGVCRCRYLKNGLSDHSKAGIGQEVLLVKENIVLLNEKHL